MNICSRLKERFLWLRKNKQQFPLIIRHLLSRKQKKAFSRFALCVIIPFLAATIINLILSAIVFYMAQAGSLSESLQSSTTFSLMISVVPLLVVFFPAVYLLTKKMPSQEPEKKPFKASQVFMFFLITIAAMVIGNFISTFALSLLTAGQGQNSIASVISAQEIIPTIYIVQYISC